MNCNYRVLAAYKFAHHDWDTFKFKEDCIVWQCVVILSVTSLHKLSSQNNSVVFQYNVQKDKKEKKLGLKETTHYIWSHACILETYTAPSVQRQYIFGSYLKSMRVLLLCEYYIFLISSKSILNVLITNLTLIISPHLT